MTIPKNMGLPYCLSDVISRISTFLRRNGAAILFDTLYCMGLAAVAGTIHCAPNYKPDSRIVPVYLGSSNQLTFPTELLYPYKDPLVSTGVCTLLVALLPSLVIVLCQTKVQSFPDFRAGTAGLNKVVLAATIVSETLKHFVGGFRPYYIEVCQPDLTLLTTLTTASNTTWWMGPAACTGDKMKVLNALWGFPSGHSATSFASAVFLALYLNGKLKPFSDHAPGVLDLATVLAPLMLASLISGSQYVSHQHHAHEVFAGILIGTICGLCGYRLRYAAVFDFRYNHIPLTTFSPMVNERHEIEHASRSRSDEKHSLRQWWARLSEKGNIYTVAGYLEAPRRKRRCLVWSQTDAGQ